ncbi:MAG: hypothetical protein ACK5LS_02585 [Propioniciclava sp.]
MAAIDILGGTFAGIAAAVRLARLGHTVALVEPDPGWAELLRGELGDGTLDFPAPWRDLLKKSGRPAVGALGRHGLELVPDSDDPPTDRGHLWYADRDALGPVAADAWRSFVDAADDTWQALRPLGLESELAAAVATRAALDPRRSLADAARRLPHPVLQDRVLSLAEDYEQRPADLPSWLVSRFSVHRTFGRWRLLGPAGERRPASDLVDVLIDRLTDRDVRVVDTAGGAPVRVETRDPGHRWHRPRRLRRSDSFVDQLLARPGTRTEDPACFHASASSPAGREPWAQLLSGALAAYAVHRLTTGEDVRPGSDARGGITAL